MENKRGILYIILILVILSLCFSVFSFFALWKTTSKIERLTSIEKEIAKLSSAIKKQDKKQDLTQIEIPQLKPGDAAPIVKLKDIHGNIVSTGKYRDEKKVVLYAWVPGCPQCEIITPHLVNFAKKHKSDKFEILTVTRIAYEEEIGGIKDYIKKKNLTLPVLISTPQDSFGMDYKIIEVPVIWIIDTDMKIIATLKGKELSEGNIEDILLKYLK